MSGFYDAVKIPAHVVNGFASRGHTSPIHRAPVRHGGGSGFGHMIGRMFIGSAINRIMWGLPMILVLIVLIFAGIYVYRGMKKNKQDSNM